MITAAADGSSLHNPGPAGWAWYIDDATWAAGGWPKGTNNMGELTAVLDLLRATRDAGEELTVLCDSQYAINCCTKWMAGWKRKGWRKADGKPVLNKEILQELDTELAGRQVHFQWVKGHAGHAMNEAADSRARAAATAYRDGTSVDHGPGFGHAPAAETAAGGADDTQNVFCAPQRHSAGNVCGEDDQEAPCRAAAPTATQLEATSSRDVTSASAGDIPSIEPFQDGLFELDAPSALVSTLADLQSRLVDSNPACRQQAMAELLSDDFIDHAADGKVRSKARLIAMDRSIKSRTTTQIDILGITEPADGVALVRWRSRTGARAELHASLWRLSGQHGDGQWQIVFSQATAI